MSQYEDLDPEDPDKSEVKRSQLLGLVCSFSGSIIHGVNMYLNRTFQLNYLVAITPRLVTLGVMGALLIAYQTLEWRWSQLKEHGTYIPHLVLGQGLSVGVINLVAYSALFLLPLGDVIVIMFSTPLFSFIYCYLILGQVVERIQLFVGLVIIVGEILVVWTQLEVPSAYSIGSILTGASLALAWANASALVSTITCGFLREIPSAVMLFYTGVPSTLAMLCTYPFQSMDLVSLWNQLAHNCLPVALMSCGALARCFLILKSLHHIDANTVSLIRCIEIVVDYILQVWALNEPAHVSELIGAGLVLGAIGLLTIHKHRN